jgi:DNA-binding XRE family transcriptional regulator
LTTTNGSCIINTTESFISANSCKEGHVLRKWLIDIRNGRSQAQIAEAVGISQQMCSAIELGERRPSVEVAKKIASVMGFNWTRFYEDEDDLTKTCTE